MKNTARLAGFLYLIVVLAGMFNLLYIPSKLIDLSNAQTTFNNIVSNETLFRLGIVAGIICYTAFLALPIVLYQLLNKVNRNHAIAMVVLAFVSVPIALNNLLHKFTILNLITDNANGSQNEVLFQLHQYNDGIKLTAIFWGLWLFPFGYLVFKSGFLPKIFGIFLMAGCFGYLINFIGLFLFKGYADLGIASFISLPSAIGEIGICLWLLIVGVKVERRLADS